MRAKLGGDSRLFRLTSYKKNRRAGGHLNYRLLQRVADAAGRHWIVKGRCAGLAGVFLGCCGGVVIVLRGVALVEKGERVPWSAHGALERGRRWREIRRKGISARCGVLSTGAAGRRTAKGIAGMEHRDSLESRAVTGFSPLSISFIPFIPQKREKRERRKKRGEAHTCVFLYVWATKDGDKGIGDNLPV